MTINLSVLNRLVEELNLSLKEFINKERKLSPEDRVVELGKVIGLTTTIALESSLLTNDLSTIVAKAGSVNTNKMMQDLFATPTAKTETNKN